MKKLMFVLGSLLMASTSMAEGLVEICGEKVDKVEVRSLVSSVSYSLERTVSEATQQGIEVKICAVGALPVAIVKIKNPGYAFPEKKAILFVPEMD